MDNNLKQTLTKFRQANDNRYAKPDGNYPTLTAGLADNFTPYSEDSGAEQENPFISNGTGTNNNIEIVTVGDYGLFKEKQGNTLVVNQYARELNAEYWATSNATVSFSEGVATFTASAANGRIRLVTSYRVQYYANHKYLMVATIKGTTNNTSAGMILNDGTDNILQITLSTSYQTFSFIATLSNTTSTGQINIIDGRSSDWDAIQVKDVFLIDLTQMFNGDIPQDLLDNPSHFSWYYNGSLAYNTGTLDNANGVKLVSTGRNIWNEEWELGAYSNSSGIPTSLTTTIRSKSTSPIRVIPNTKYNVKVGANGTYSYWYYYDKDMNFISYEARITGHATYGIFTTPSNCEYVRFYVADAYGTTYKNDITISLYYTPAQGGEGYDKYYPYEEPYVVDTGTEVLRKAGSVKDYKEPNGTIHRVVGVVDLSTLSWNWYGENNCWYSTDLSIVSANGICDKYTQTPSYVGMPNNSFVLRYAVNTIYVKTDGTNSVSPTGILYYELATPTTEQGTPFAENLPINDYGMLYWLDSSNNLVGIPQGAKIFYPTNYKGFVDDMYSRVDGDSSKYVIDTELSAEETARSNQDTILQNAIGGTLRQLLASSKNIDFNNTDVVDLGDLNWGNVENDNTTVTSSINTLIKRPLSSSVSANMLCTKYKNVARDNLFDTTCITCNTAGNIIIHDTSLAGKTSVQVKNAMKGVLLAYEKA